jgi:hypothetical protein
MFRKMKTLSFEWIKENQHYLTVGQLKELVKQYEVLNATK